MAFSQRACAYALNPTLPCPTLPLSPRALSESSIIPAAGRLCLKFIFLVSLTGFDLRQSLPAAGIIEESESARGERGKVGQGRVGFRA